MNEMRRRKLTVNNVEALPEKAGVYLLYGPTDYVSYVGRGDNVPAKLQQHLETGDVHAVAFRVIFIECPDEARAKEASLIEYHAPQFNVTAR